MVKKVIAGCFAVLILGGLSYYSSYLYSSRQIQNENVNFMERKLTEQTRLLAPDTVLEKEKLYPQTQEAERQEVLTEPDSVQAEAEEFLYYIMEEGGQVVVRYSDRTTLYEDTNISVDSLPPELQEELKRGKGVTEEGELYDFLENYSS